VGGRLGLDVVELGSTAEPGGDAENHRFVIALGGDRAILRAPLSVELDGRTIEEMPTSAALEVHAAPGKARLLRTRPRTFYADLVKRL
jgi:hypothetical protein